MQYEEEYALLIELQKLDNKIDTTREEIKKLPEKLREMDDHIENLKKELVELDAEMKKKELRLREKNSEYRDAQTKLSHFKKQLLDIKTNDEYRAMLSQIENQKRLIEKIEEEILLLEEEMEEFKNELPKLKEDIKIEIQKIDEEKAHVKEGYSSLEKSLKALLDERNRLEGEIKVSVLRKYERLRAKGYNKVLVPIKRIVGNEGEEYVCSFCHSTVPLEISLKIREGESFLRCENCGRYLYFEEEIKEVE